MPRLGLALILFACVSHGAATIGGNARAEDAELMRCLDAATGKLLWEAPFSGSPSWSRQFPPVVHGNLAIYASGSGTYAYQGTEKPFTFKGTQRL